MLRQVLGELLSSGSQQWLAEALERIAAQPAEIHAVFPGVGSCCDRLPIERGPEELIGWTTDDAVRSLLLASCPLAGEALREAIHALFAFGTAAERRGVLRALPLLAIGDNAGLAFVRTALCDEDMFVVAAALGPYAAARLPAAEYREAAIRCLVDGVAPSLLHIAVHRFGAGLIAEAAVRADRIISRPADGDDAGVWSERSGPKGLDPAWLSTGMPTQRTPPGTPHTTIG